MRENEARRIRAVERELAATRKSTNGSQPAKLKYARIVYIEQGQAGGDREPRVYKLPRSLIEANNKTEE